MKSLDDEIREHFADLAAEDSRRAPPFSTLWREAERRAAALKRPASIARRWWFLAAAGAVVATALVVRRGSRDGAADSAPVDPTAYPSIVGWRAPTDGLLLEARRSVAGSSSTFGSLLDNTADDSSPSTPHK